MGAGYAQIFLDTAVEECVSRDSRRPVPVGETIIRNMAKKLERPNASKHTWEENTIELANVEFSDNDLQRLLTMIATPVAPIQELDVQEQEKYRQANVTSFRHQLDLTSRRLVSQALADAEISLKKRLGAPANQLRQAFLKSCDATQYVTSTASLDEAVSLASSDFAEQLESVASKIAKSSPE